MKKGGTLPVLYDCLRVTRLNSKCHKRVPHTGQGKVPFLLASVSAEKMRQDGMIKVRLRVMSMLQTTDFKSWLDGAEVQL